MNKKVMYISEDNVLRVLDVLKMNNNCRLLSICEILKLGRTTVHKAIVELKRRKWIKAKAERVNNVVEYQIIKKD